MIILIPFLIPFFILVVLALFLGYVVYSCLMEEEIYREMFDDTEPPSVTKSSVKTKVLKVRHKM